MIEDVVSLGQILTQSLETDRDAPDRKVGCLVAPEGVCNVGI